MVEEDLSRCHCFLLVLPAMVPQSLLQIMDSSALYTNDRCFVRNNPGFDGRIYYP